MYCACVEFHISPTDDYDTRSKDSLMLRPEVTGYGAQGKTTLCQLITNCTESGRMECNARLLKNTASVDPMKKINHP